jgi:hypothetical protein
MRHSPGVYAYSFLVELFSKWEMGSLTRKIWFLWCHRNQIQHLLILLK